MKILAIDGMRAIFALWVLIGHVLSNAGFAKSDLWIGFKLLHTGTYAVDLFIIISGFVIFLLLDHKKENYSAYITRRFCRLFPVFLLLFLFSIPIFLLVPQNAESYSHLFVHKPFPHLEYISTWWDNIEIHVISHLFMLHGIVPESVAPGAPIAFLGPAWSISLEWQFYLLAPLFFFFANRYLTEDKNYAKAIGFILCTFAFSFLLMKLYPKVSSGAFLPYNLHFFMIGWASYFLSKYFSSINVDRDLILLVCLLFAGVIVLITEVYSAGGHIFPFLIWLILFPFIIVSDKGEMVQKLTCILDNKFLTYIGKISYSLYLTHRLLIILIMKAISPVAKELSSLQLFWILLPTTVITSIGVSALLYRFIEAPSINLGTKISGYNQKLCLRD
jgi:peptidoglycan/LPS O-acetylase OafA/YrhL